MSVNRIMLMRAIDCCIAEDCKSCPTNNGLDNCIKELLKGAKQYMLHLETNAYLTRSDFAKFLIDKAENGVIDISDLPGYVKEAGRALAKKTEIFCNKCGKEIVNPIGCYGSTSFLKNYSAKITLWGVGEPRSSFGERIDLCVECYNKFINFLEEGA